MHDTLPAETRFYCILQLLNWTVCSLVLCTQHLPILRLTGTSSLTALIVSQRDSSNVDPLSFATIIWNGSVTKFNNSLQLECKSCTHTCTYMNYIYFSLTILHVVCLYSAYPNIFSIAFLRPLQPLCFCALVPFSFQES